MEWPDVRHRVSSCRLRCRPGGGSRPAGASGEGRSAPGASADGRFGAAFAFFVAGLHLVTAIEICFGLASSRCGSVTRRTPSLNSALILSVSTTFGSVNERLNVP